MNLKTIVVATDCSENSLPALKTAFQLTMETTATLYLVHVIEVPAVAPAIARRRAGRTTDRATARARTKTIGQPDSERLGA